MRAELGFAFAVWFAAVMVAIQLCSASYAPQSFSPTPTVTSVPSATATLAPIGEPAATVSAPSSSATPKILGHEIVNAFCSAFIAHFNVAATTMLADDKLLDDATAAETDYENDFFRLDGATRSWDHRLALIAALTRIMRTIPDTQAAVNELRMQAAASADPQRHAALAESASQLQASIDHQRIIANELQDAVDAMLDLHTAEDTIGFHGSLGAQKIFASDDAPIPHPGDTLPQPRPSGVYYASAVEQILHMPRGRRLVAAAESNAESAVMPAVRSCNL
ncbi:MAG TPA: hypothetical protein VJN22_08715 [Candidatus Eremiobacteraceae bacterium]|nr:hypothetical protein [Candidatus Eremiobacteraceae bacterium]